MTSRQIASSRLSRKGNGRSRTASQNAEEGNSGKNQKRMAEGRKQKKRKAGCDQQTPLGVKRLVKVGMCLNLKTMDSAQFPT